MQKKTEGRQTGHFRLLYVGYKTAFLFALHAPHSALVLPARRFLLEEADQRLNLARLLLILGAN